MEDFLRSNGFTTAENYAKADNTSRDNVRKGGWSAPVPRRKKIDPSSGDYTRFTDLPADSGKNSPSTEPATENAGETEPQTIDVTWEELPPDHR